eukprot:2341869-Ditylum_brightwellii.AAC.1
MTAFFALLHVETNGTVCDVKISLAFAPLPPLPLCYLEEGRGVDFLLWQHPCCCEFGVGGSSGGGKEA